MDSTLDSAPSSGRLSYPLDWISISFVTVFHALALIASWFFSWQALAVAIFPHWLAGSLGICLGYHRLLTHHSFKVPKWLEYTLAVCGALALQGGPIAWASGPRLHHAYTEDEERAPYSARRGFWWSHMLWFFYKRENFFDYSAYRKYALDLDRQPFYRFLDRYYLLFQIPLVASLYCLGGWSFIIYGLFVRTVWLWHSTWLINSASRIRGYRTFKVKDNSRNLWWAALLTYGEGWHNNHHAQPNIAPAGRRWWEIDATWWVILCLECLGLATKVRRPALETVIVLGE